MDDNIHSKTNFSAEQPAPPLRPRFCVSCEGQHDEMKHALEQDRVLDVERLGFNDLLDVADAILRHYPPDTIVCSHLHRADIGARTVAAIADLVTSARLGSAPPRSEPEDDPISDSRQPEDGPPPGRWPR